MQYRTVLLYNSHMMLQDAVPLASVLMYSSRTRSSRSTVHSMPSNCRRTCLSIGSTFAAQKDNCSASWRGGFSPALSSRSATFSLRSGPSRKTLTCLRHTPKST